MKFIFALLLCCCLAGGASAHSDSIPAHLANLKLPDFKLLLTDSTTSFYKDNLRPNKQTIIIMFSPDCDHCKRQTTELLANIRYFKNVQIVMPTTLPFEKMKAFYEEFQIKKYKNITMGRDVLFFFSRYFQSHYLPYIAVYNKKGDLLNAYDGEVSIQTLIEQVH
ncbi:MAG: hypothetical protein U0T11_08010 [Chitinophagaceae bacterium]